MTTNPYWIRLRGVPPGKGKKPDYDKGKVFGGPNFQKGVEIYVGTQQGAAILKVYADDQARVRARVMTAQHRWPPKVGEMRGKVTVQDEFLVRDPEQDLGSAEQMKLFGVGADVCRKCMAPVYWTPGIDGRNIPLNVEPEARLTLDTQGRARPIEVFDLHSCPAE